MASIALTQNGNAAATFIGSAAANTGVAVAGPVAATVWRGISRPTAAAAAPRSTNQFFM